MRLKKLSGVVLAAVMTVGMCSTAFAADISEGLARVATAGEIDGEVVDLRTVVDKDCELNILTFNDVLNPVIFLSFPLSNPFFTPFQKCSCVGVNFKIIFFSVINNVAFVFLDSIVKLQLNSQILCRCPRHSFQRKVCCFFL